MFRTFQKTKAVCTSVRRGFSIIELMIVMAIILIMTTVLFVNRGNSRAQNDVDAATRLVAAQIRALQNESLTGKRIKDGTIMKNANQHIFTVNSSDLITYNISYKDSSGGSINAGTQSFNLTKKRVKFDSAVSFYFESPRGDVASKQDIVLKSNDDSVTRHICVSVNGNVTEQKTACL